MTIEEEDPVAAPRQGEQPQEPTGGGEHAEQRDRRAVHASLPDLQGDGCDDEARHRGGDERRVGGVGRRRGGIGRQEERPQERGGADEADEDVDPGHACAVHQPPGTHDRTSGRR
jgi:hypothetical protein